MIVNIALVILVVIISMTIHEFMHGYVAHRLGDSTPEDEGRLTLNPLKHIDPFLTILLPVFLAVVGGPIFGGAKPVPFNPANVRWGEWGVALVAVSGPLVNLMIAFISYGAIYFLPVGVDYTIVDVLSMFVAVNLGFFIFNMLPIPPLDGSRLLYAFAPDFVRGVMMQLENFGLILVFVIVFFSAGLLGGIIGGVSSFFIGLFDLVFAIF